ncbi:hypothetical protein A2160_02935 [Candidatus Beckwithbacteria bacterium RBG_13_42_9]|uniref:Glycosyltransferase RgtA/B/C/D-like domain-containing protein n=1 Tax=Candidatus Beckwithbacteria bacterium RBG_13_42_9 TaxID=1797457 RepID=A0A1F5E7R0_9BACT|nr:MAG: hypothetical protein A2160_02935 [Candidatus Beckwithbacteria bacterium RBG_13_42_9]
MNLKDLILLSLVILLAIVLRFYHLSSNPPAPYWEEAALGYDAYSILKTGKDFHGQSFPLVAFESFGDWKPSLYFYASVFPIKFFGLDVFSVRFASALAGVLTVLLIYLIVKTLLNYQTALLSALLLTISPWHLQLSRVGFETNLGLFLVVLGFYFFLNGLKKGWWLILASLSWGLSIYAYHALRVFIPLMGLTLGIYYLRQLWLKKTWMISGIILFFILIFPVINVLNQPQIQQRFAETSAFTTLEPILTSNRLIAEDGEGKLAKLIHHRFWQYLNIFTNNYVSHFSFDYLFLKGDSNPRHSVQLVGNLYLVQLPFLILGIYYLFSKKRWRLLPLLFWLILAPIPAAITTAVPHALRSLPMVIPLIILSAYGLVELTAAMKKSFPKKFILLYCSIALLLLILLAEFSRYLFIYYVDYPRDNSQYWQYGYREMINYVTDHQGNYAHIYITRELGRPSIYYWFYNQTDPRQVQAVSKVVPKDQGEYLAFDKIDFSLPEGDKLQKPALVVMSQEEAKFGTPLKKINYLNGERAFTIYELK